MLASELMQAARIAMLEITRFVEARKFLPVFTVLFVGSCASAPLPGWRYPGEGDYQGDWLTYRDRLEKPFHAEDDFNGDGVSDEAWILFSGDG